MEQNRLPNIVDNNFSLLISPLKSFNGLTTKHDTFGLPLHCSLVTT